MTGMPDPQAILERMETAPPADRDEVLDVVIGLGATVVACSRFAVIAARPVVGLALRPPFVPYAYSPQASLDAAARIGQRVRAQMGPLLDRVVPPVAAAVIDRVDINAVVARTDIEAVVTQVDLNAIAHRVLDELDLPDIIRESSGSLASESVVGIRMQGIAADERVNQIVDKLLLRRNGRKPTPRPAPAGPGFDHDAQ
jgi:hypothetical protein